jgi:CRISPR-associated protein Csd1
MTAYVEGLRRLIHYRYVSARTGDSVVPQNTPLSADTTAVYWASVQSDIPGLLGDLMYSPQKVRELLKSPHRGVQSSGAKGRFFCLIVSGAKGRAMMRSVHTGTLDALEENLENYFNAIQVEKHSQQPLPLVRLLLATIVPDPGRKGDRPSKKEWEKRLRPGLIGKIWLSALFGEPLPHSVLAAAVTRNKAEQRVPPERAALLQLYFASHKQKEVPIMSLDAGSNDAPYRLGRLLSAYEQLQYLAHQLRSPGSKLNRTLVDRYFGAASTRPGVVFPQLAQLSQSHLRILGRYRSTPDRLITEIFDGFEGISFPAMLTLEEQGRFALGYYHQRQTFFRSRKDSDATTEQNTPTPEGENIQ